MCPACNVAFIQKGFCQVGLTKRDEYTNYELNSEHPRNDKYSHVFLAQLVTNLLTLIPVFNYNVDNLLTL